MAESSQSPDRQEIIDQLRTNSLEWVELDDREKKAKEDLKIVASRKKELSESILHGLTSIDQTEIGLKRGGRLKFSSTTTYAPLKKDDIFNVIKQELDDENRARAILDKLYSRDGKEAKTVVALKRTTR